jgi:hypothetical protein
VKKAGHYLKFAAQKPITLIKKENIRSISDPDLIGSVDLDPKTKMTPKNKDISRSAAVALISLCSLDWPAQDCCMLCMLRK